MGNHKVVISMGCFFRWLRHATSTQALADELGELLDNSGDEIVGMELYVGWHELAPWLETLRGGPCLPPRSSKLPKALHEKILGLPNNYIHLPPLKQLALEREGWFAETIRGMHHYTGISEFTIHPDQTSARAWKRLLALIPREITISVENLDHNSSDFQTSQDIANLLRAEPQLAWTLDTSHWMSSGRPLNSPELAAMILETPPSKIHYSASSSFKSSLTAEEVGNHFPVSQADNNAYSAFITELKAQSIYCPVVLEGAINEGEFEVIYHELSHLRRIVEATSKPSSAPRGISVPKAA